MNLAQIGIPRRHRWGRRCRLAGFAASA
jgi:hypothetical protein